MDEATIRLIHERLQAAPNWHELSSVLGRTSADDPELSALVRALDYDLVDAGSTERLERWGPYAPMIETTAGSYPAPLDEAPVTDQAAWAATFDAIDHPLIRSRLGDLLWVRCYGERSHLYARAAHAAYLELGEAPDVDPLDAAQLIERASQLAANLNDPEMRAAAANKCASALRVAIDDAESGPGVVLRLLESLNRMPVAHQPDDVDELVMRALRMYESDPWLFESAADIAISRAKGDATRQRVLGAAKVNAWRVAAAASSGLVKSAHLERALDQARIHGLIDDGEEILRDLQELEGTYELEAVSANVTVPGQQIEDYLNSFIADTFEDSLRRLGAHCPLPESFDDTAATVQDLMRRYPLQHLFNKVILGPLDLPLRRVVTEEEHLDSAIYAHESQSISFWSTFAADILERIKAKFDPTREEVVRFFAAGLVGQSAAERFADSLMHFWARTYDASLMICLPRLESVVRDTCRNLGLVIYVAPQGPKAGSLKTLGSLLSDLSGRFHEQTRHYLQVLLSDPFGYNLRNRAMHGLIADGTAPDAALALHAACRLTLFAIEGSEQNSG